jgi:hypothetical protein
VLMMRAVWRFMLWLIILLLLAEASSASWLMGTLRGPGYRSGSLKNTSNMILFPLEFFVCFQVFASSPAFQFPASLPSNRLWLQVSYSPGWQVISPPSPPGDQEGCSMGGTGQPPPEARPHVPTPQLPGVRRGGRSVAAAAATVLLPPPISQASHQHAPPSATILHQMFSTCVVRGIAARLVYKTVRGKVETNLYCSMAAAASPATAASGSQKKGRKRPDNERRKMRRESWLQRRTVLQPDYVSAAS